MVSGFVKVWLKTGTNNKEMQFIYEMQRNIDCILTVIFQRIINTEKPKCANGRKSLPKLGNIRFKTKNRKEKHFQ